MAWTYTYTFPLLKSIFAQKPDSLEIPSSPVGIRNRSLLSERRDVLPGAGPYVCAADGAEFPAGERERDTRQRGPQDDDLTCADITCQENGGFRYSLLQPRQPVQAANVIFMLHGLNEREWHKYLPWAFRLVELTGAAVCLLPLAFHMNRAPAAWSRPKAMKPVAAERQIRFPSVTASSVVNAAISARLHTNPQRFFWSGMQTYYDILQLVREIRAGRHRDVQPQARVDFVGYSMGVFLAQILLMTNEERLFDRSRLFSFCGGPTFDRMYPVSKHILDSEALIALYAFFIEQLDVEFTRDPRLAHYFQMHPAGRYFRAMLSNRKLKGVREQRLRELSDQIMAVALRQDEVIQPSEVINTLTGDNRDIPIKVHVRDFPYAYTHVNPFSHLTRWAEEVNHAFDDIMGLAASHLCP
jgi:hypothetical protein